MHIISQLKNIHTHPDHPVCIHLCKRHSLFYVWQTWIGPLSLQWSLLANWKWFFTSLCCAGMHIYIPYGVPMHRDGSRILVRGSPLRLHAVNQKGTLHPKGWLSSSISGRKLWLVWLKNGNSAINGNAWPIDGNTHSQLWECLRPFSRTIFWAMKQTFGLSTWLISVLKILEDIYLWSRNRKSYFIPCFKYWSSTCLLWSFTCLGASV